MEFRTQRQDIALELTKKFYDQIKYNGSPDELREDFSKTYKAMFKAVTEAQRESGEKSGIA